MRPNLGGSCKWDSAASWLPGSNETSEGPWGATLLRGGTATLKCLEWGCAGFV